MSQIVKEKPSARPMPITRNELKTGLWSTDIKIQFGDCDPAGIVYTPNFFHMFNVAIENWYEAALGLNYYEIIKDRRIGVGYVNAHADFFSPGHMGNTLNVTILVEHIGNSSFVLLLHGFQGEVETVRGRMTVVTTDLNKHRPIVIPEDLRGALLNYKEAGKEPSAT